MLKKTRQTRGDSSRWSETDRREKQRERKITTWQRRWVTRLFDAFLLLGHPP